jgi:hypothetical protein
MMSDAPDLMAAGALTAILVNNDEIRSAEEPLRHKRLKVCLTIFQGNGPSLGFMCSQLEGV